MRSAFSTVVLCGSCLSFAVPAGADPISVDAVAEQHVSLAFEDDLGGSPPTRATFGLIGPHTRAAAAHSSEHFGEIVGSIDFHQATAGQNYLAFSLVGRGERSHAWVGPVFSQGSILFQWPGRPSERAYEVARGIRFRVFGNPPSQGGGGGAPVAPTPEPATLLLVGSGAVALAARRRLQKR